MGFRTQAKGDVGQFPIHIMDFRSEGVTEQASLGSQIKWHRIPGTAIITHPLDKLRLSEAQSAGRDQNEAEMN